MAVQATTSIAVPSHLESTASAAFASTRSIVKPYFRRTSSVRATNQHALRSGVHSATSLALLRCQFTVGPARVRFRRSDANAAFAPADAAHRPLSWASEVATMCSMSVSRVLPKQRPVYGP